LFVKK